MQLCRTGSVGMGLFPTIRARSADVRKRRNRDVQRGRQSADDSRDASGFRRFWQLDLDAVFCPTHRCRRSC